MALDPKQQREEVEKLNKEIKELYAQLGRTTIPPIFKADEIDKATDAVVGLKAQIGAVNEEMSFVASSFRDAVNSLSKQNTEAGKVKNALRSISSIASQIRIENEDIAKVDLKRIDTLEKRAKLQFDSLQISLDSLDVESEEAKEAKFALGEQQNFLNILQQIREEQKIINKSSGVKLFSGLEGISNAIPGLKNFTSAFSDASKSARAQAANNLQGIGKSMSPMMAGIKSLGPSLTKALGPIYLITELIGAFGKVNKESVELQKSMALSSNEAASFRSNLSTAAKQSGDINVTASKLLKTFSEVNKQFGFITNFASSTLVTMTKLTSVVGVSSEAAGNLAAASTLTGKSFESNYKDVLGTSYELQRQEGVQFDLREILEETGKVTGTVRANLGANPANIAKAITQAKLFGASLQQVASAGKSLLDFESSITSELEAELLLGKDINLERARLAALNGDQVTLAKELRKEAGDYDDFMKMNVLQQEAIAKAMGMQSDELADILFKQDIQGKTAKELRALGKDELADRLEAQTVQDKFNASVEKLKEIFADVATALMPVFEFLGMIFNLVGKIVKFLEPIMGILGGAATGAAAGAAFGPAGIVPGAIIGAITGGVSDVSRASRADDAIIPPGYGNTVIKKGRDTIALNNNDTVVAGTNLGGGNNSEAKETNTLLRQILSKQGTIKLDSTDMGTAMSVNRYAIQ
jgi:hypothetical protein